MYSYYNVFKPLIFQRMIAGIIIGLMIVTMLVGILILGLKSSESENQKGKYTPHICHN